MSRNLGDIKKHIENLINFEYGYFTVAENMQPAIIFTAEGGNAEAYIALFSSPGRPVDFRYVVKDDGRVKKVEIRL